MNNIICTPPEYNQKIALRVLNKRVTKFTPIISRIMTTTLKLKRKTSIIQLYTPIKGPVKKK